MPGSSENPAEPFDRPHGKQQSDGSTRHRQYEALREHLLNQPGAAAAHRHPDGQFLLACRGARQEQRRDVGAGNEQDEADRPEQQPDRAADGADDLLA